MKVLAIDTSTYAASAALISEGSLCCEYILNDGKKHSEKIIDLIDMVIKSCSFEAKDIDLFACSTGPGSFTGLRVGASAIKGIAQAINKPVVGVPTLDALAYNIWGYNGFICPILDAQRGMVYSSLYKSCDYDIIKTNDFSAIAIENLIKELSSIKENIIFLGDGISIFKNDIMGNMENAYFAQANSIYPRASSVASLAVKMHEDGGTFKYNELELSYIRKSQAEVEYEKKNEIKISFMKEKDIKEMAEIEKLCFTTPWSYESFLSELKDNHLAKYVVAKAENKVVGYAGMWFVLDEAHITNIAVHPGFSGRGIGDRLVKEIMNTARENMIKRITLEVRSTNNQAIRLYKRNGFIAEGIRKGYYTDTKEDALIMWKEL